MNPTWAVCCMPHSEGDGNRPGTRWGGWLGRGMDTSTRYLSASVWSSSLQRRMMKRMMKEKPKRGCASDVGVDTYYARVKAPWHIQGVRDVNSHHVV